MHKSILAHFESTDAVLYELALRYTLREQPAINPNKYLEALCRSIVGQQLSVKAAATIWVRATAAVGNWDQAESIIGVPDETLRQAGLSGQKVRYVKNIAEAVSSGSLNIHAYTLMKDNDILNELVAIKGVGVWTAEMFLMFTMGREDVFSGRDLGLRRAIEKLYGMESITPKDADAFAARWAPYRTYASRLLWHSLDNTPSDQD